ncbi:MAG: hypothetical protein ACLFPL_04555 [Candidatus Nanoarchaeia archaeon]
MAQKIFFNKKAQLATLSVFALLLVLLVLYSTETPNIFNTQVSYSYVIDSVETQFCEHTINSPQGIVLNNSLSQFDGKMEEYCTREFVNCTLSSHVKTNPLGNNISELNYSHVALKYNFSSQHIRLFNKEVIC